MTRLTIDLNRADNDYGIYDTENGMQMVAQAPTYGDAEDVRLMLLPSYPSSDTAPARVVSVPSVAYVLELLADGRKYDVAEMWLDLADAGRFLLSTDIAAYTGWLWERAEVWARLDAMAAEFGPRQIFTPAQAAKIAEAWPTQAEHLLVAVGYSGNSTGGFDGGADIDPDDAPGIPECCGGQGCPACYEPEPFEFIGSYVHDTADDIPF